MNFHFYKDYRDEYISGQKSNIVRVSLIRKIQAYLSSYNVEQIRDKTSLYNDLYGLDFKSAKRKKLTIDLSFTYFHWKISETLFDQNMNYEVSFLSEEEVKLLALNIFPNFKTAGHYVYKDTQHVKKLYEMARKENKEFGPIEVPYIRDFFGDSPLHLCVKANNFQATAAILEAIKDDPLDTHSRVIVDLFPVFIDRKIAAFNTYLLSRQFQTKALQRIKRGDLVDYSLCERAVTNAEQWADENVLRKNLLEDKDQA